MIQKYLYWFIIMLGTILPYFFDTIADEQGRHYPFIWSIFLIPSILIMFKYPRWNVVIGIGIFYTLVELAIEFNQKDFFHFSMDEIALYAGIIVNWSILLTVGYLRIQSEKLLLKVEEMTITDTLTGIFNRRYFNL